MYCYYSKVYTDQTDHGLYAFTENKKFAKRFESERNMDMFKKQVIDISDYTEDTYRSFMSNYRLRMMIEEPLTDKEGNDVTLIATYYEDSILSETFDILINDIDETLEDIQRLENYGQVKKGFTKFIATFLTYYNNQSVMDASVDTFHMFIDCFWETFYSTDYVKIYADDYNEM